jgi:hypothetical protein
MICKLLAVLLRVADDVALRQAVDPLIVKDGSAFAAKANAAAVEKICGSFLGGLAIAFLISRAFELDRPL